MTKTFTFAAAALALALAAPGAASAALSISVNTDVAAGIAAFGSSTPQLTWANMFAPGTVWTAGTVPPQIGGAVLVDPATGSSVTGGLNLGNWIDGAGFDLTGGGAGPDLALDGDENFVLTFAAPVYRIGFAVSTGLGNYVPAQTDNLGAGFNLTASNGELGTFTLVDPGMGATAWITISSTTAFTSLAFVEDPSNIYDQYFGNVVSGGAVPETGTWALMILGFAGAGGMLRRRRATFAT